MPSSRTRSLSCLVTSLYTTTPWTHTEWNLLTVGFLGKLNRERPLGEGVGDGLRGGRVSEGR